MGSRGANFDHWCLPHGSNFSKEDTYASTGDPLHDAKHKAWHASEMLKIHNSQENRELRQTALDNLEMIRNQIILDTFEKLETENDDSESDLVYNQKWDPKEAETIVSHMIFTKKKETDKETQILKKPMQYVLRHPTSSHGENLVKIYTSHAYNNEKNIGIKKVFYSMKEFFSSEAGLFVAQNINSRERDPVVREMKNLEKILNDISDGLNNPHYENELGIDYATNKNMFNDIVVELDDGSKAVFQITTGRISTKKLDYPDIIKKFVDASKFFEGTEIGLFCAIARIFDDGSNITHYLFLSEYNKKWMRSITCCGPKSTFDDNSFRYDVRAILPRISFYNEQEISRTQWTIRWPFTEEMIMEDHFRFFESKEPYVSGIKFEYMDSLREFVIKQTDYYNNVDSARDVPDSPIKTYFYSGDSFAFLVTIFNKDYQDILKLFVEKEDDLKEDFVIVTTVRYPNIFIKTEQIMKKMKWKYFMNNIRDESKWHDWNRGLAFKQHRRSQAIKYNPEEFQIEPAPGDLPADVKDEPEEDKNKRETYPLRLLKSLPEHASYAAVVRKRRHDDRFNKEKNNTSYYVNDLDDDAEVVWEYKTNGTIDSNGAWDSIQLFRINAEILVSRVAAKYGMKTFFRFREDHSGTKVGLFREYLKLEHDGKKVLMEEWRKIWAEKIHQIGWIEHRKKEKKENQQQQHRHQTHQPQRHQPQHQRHPATAPATKHG